MPDLPGLTIDWHQQLENGSYTGVETYVHGCTGALLVHFETRGRLNLVKDSILGWNYNKKKIGI